jgi:hypothetical protein
MTTVWVTGASATHGTSYRQVAAKRWQASDLQTFLCAVTTPDI